MDIILAIKPEWAAKIYSGEKIIEWRKTKPKNFRDYNNVILYETTPVKKNNRLFKALWDSKKRPEEIKQTSPFN